ncbi:glycosyltransferase family 4 protein [Gemmatimonas sp.]|uniref:glycosyltransferase family 4 protein n=1 Tax=Gemmatimonas sp. TaxID=1962908 RepID=UPI0039838873
MKIGIDACTWVNRRGYGRFTRGLVHAMVDACPQHEFTLVVDGTMARDASFPARAHVHVVPTSERQATAASANGSRRPSDLLRMGRAIGALDVDVFLFPTSFSYVPVFGRTPVVTVFHDATAEMHPTLIFPRAVPRWLWTIKSQVARRQSTCIVTVSENARIQIARVFGMPASEIEVVSEGADPIFQPHDEKHEKRHDESAAVRAQYGLPADRSLLLYVGGVSPHKNIDGLLRAVVALPVATLPWHLVIVGDVADDTFLTCYEELQAQVRELGLGGRVSFTGFVPDAQLAALYRASTLLVLPSFSEGFGLPVLEAMACGLPVAVSDRFSLPEIVGTAGVLFDPTSAPAITQSLARVLGDAELRAAMRAKGLKRADEYSWRRGAERMVHLLERVAAPSGAVA